MGRIGSIALIVIGLAAAIVASDTFFVVKQTQQALVTQLGEPRRVIQEPGLQIKVPFVQRAVLFDRRILDLDTNPEEVLTLDQKRLIVDAFARFKIVDPLKFFQSVNNEFRARERLSRLFNTSVRTILAEREFSTLLTGERADSMLKIRADVNEKARELGIEIIDVRIRRADLPQDNSNAVYNRMRAERDREAREARAQGREISQRIRSRADKEAQVLLAEARRDAEILRGEGDAQRNKIFAEAFGKDQDFFAFYRAMQAYESALGSTDTTMVLSPDSEFFRYFQNPQGTVPEGARRQTQPARPLR